MKGIDGRTGKIGTAPNVKHTRKNMIHLVGSKGRSEAELFLKKIRKKERWEEKR